MNIFAKLGQDIVRLWSEYAGLYLSGVWNTISLAVLCTAVGCLIGLLCGMGTAPIDYSAITCVPAGNAPENVAITVDGNSVEVAFN